MPVAAPRWCSRCAAPHPSGAECPAGAADRRARVDRHRPSARRRGYTAAWELERMEWLSEHPWCAACGRQAEVVDHVADHHGNQALFWDRRNWRSMCKRCHNAKTMGTLNQRRRHAHQAY